MEMFGYLWAGLGLALLGPTWREFKRRLKNNEGIGEGVVYLGGIVFLIVFGCIFIFATPVSEREL